VGSEALRRLLPKFLRLNVRKPTMDYGAALKTLGAAVTAPAGMEVLRHVYPVERSYAPSIGTARIDLPDAGAIGRLTGRRTDSDGIPRN
jgi:hypothetical protein